MSSDEIEIILKKTIKKIKTITDGNQQVFILKEIYLFNDIEKSARLFELLIQKGYSKNYLLFPIFNLFETELKPEDKLKLKLIALKEGYTNIFQLLSEPQPALISEEIRIPDYGKDRNLTLGERKALARKFNRLILEKVLLDPDPAVIRNLLNNPRITELDVIRLSAHKPNQREILTMISMHPKWSKSYRVKLALVMNPYTPTHISMRLSMFLIPKDLKEVIASENLQSFLRNFCKNLISYKF